MQPKGRLLLVRHGQTAANVDKVWHGHTDTPLNPTGQQQTVKLGKYFHNYMPEIHAIYSSPLERARHTAEQIAEGGGHSINIDPRLVEFGIGEWEGRSFDDLKNETDFVDRMMTDEHHRAPGGETRYEVTQRFLTAVEGFWHSHSNENVVVVAHGLAIAFTLSHLIENDTAKWQDYLVSNTGVTEVCLNQKEIISLGRTDHL
ncbi:MAG: histidine phosphatase family protein [Porticoccaceae bacterium]